MKTCLLFTDNDIANNIQKAYPSIFLGYDSARLLPQLFDDSTHDIWRLDVKDEPKAILKVCRENVIQTALFWQGMQGLFQFYFSSVLNEYPNVYGFLNCHCDLQLPKLIASDSQSAKLSGFQLTEFLPYPSLHADMISPDHVKQLARHLAKLHQFSHPFFGSLIQPEGTVKQWPQQCYQTIKQLAQEQKIDLQAYQSELKAALLTEDSFCPIMMDLRWDQFMQTPDGKLVLLDVDAMVFAPKAIEFTLLEYLLTPEQCLVFKHQYQEAAGMPCLKKSRQAYRILLFLMNVLGETDLDKWLSQPVCFD